MLQDGLILKIQTAENVIKLRDKERLDWVAKEQFLRRRIDTQDQVHIHCVCVCVCVCESVSCV